MVDLQASLIVLESASADLFCVAHVHGKHWLTTGMTISLTTGKVYMIQQLDKGAVSQAAVFDLREATNLQGSEYSWLSSCVYVSQLIFQPLSSYALVVFPGQC